MVRISKATVGFASGSAIVDPELWRQLFDKEAGEELEGLLAALANGRDLDIDGQVYKKVPKPYAPNHPRAELLKHKSFQARWVVPTPTEVHDQLFVDWAADGDQRRNTVLIYPNLRIKRD